MGWEVAGLVCEILVPLRPLREEGAGEPMLEIPAMAAA
jgi:hypothetical protein